MPRMSESPPRAAHARKPLTCGYVEPTPGLEPGTCRLQVVAVYERPIAGQVRYLRPWIGWCASGCASSPGGLDERPAATYAWPDRAAVASRASHLLRSAPSDGPAA